MKSSQRESSLSYEKNESYIRELNYLQEWFDHLLTMFEQAKKPSRERNILKLNIAFVIEVLMYNLFSLTRQTHHKLIKFLGRPDFTKSFTKINFPSLVNVIDLHAQHQPLNVSQTNTWEKFSGNLRISTVRAYGVWLVDGYKQVSITNHFNETVGSINVSPVERLKTRLNFRTQSTLTKYILGHANSQSYTLSTMEKKKFKDRCAIAETKDPKEFKKVFQLKTSEIRLPLEKEILLSSLKTWLTPLKDWLVPLKNWWHRGTIMMSDLTIRVTMLCELAEDQSILSLRGQAMLQKFLSQTKEEIKAKISAQENKWFSKLGLNNALYLQLKNLITRITKIEKLHLNFQPQQPAEEGGQGDGHVIMTGCSVDSDVDSDLDLEDEPSAELITEDTVITDSFPRLLPTVLRAQQLLPDLLQKEEKTGAVQPQQQKRQAIDNTQLKKNQPTALNTPPKKSAQLQPTESDHINRNSKANQNHVIQTQLAVRQVKQPVLNKSLVPVPNQPQPFRKKNHYHPQPRVNPNTTPKLPQVKPVAAPANAGVSKTPSQAELTALKTMNIYALRRKAEKLKEEQRMNNVQPTILQAEAGSILVHP